MYIMNGRQNYKKKSILLFFLSLCPHNTASYPLYLLSICMFYGVMYKIVYLLWTAWKATTHIAQVIALGICCQVFMPWKGKMHETAVYVVYFWLITYIFIYSGFNNHRKETSIFNLKKEYLCKQIKETRNTERTINQPYCSLPTLHEKDLQKRTTTYEKDNLPLSDTVKHNLRREWTTAKV